jgi:hypothetical protein
MIMLLLACAGFTSSNGCGSDDSDAKQQEANERILAEGTSQTGMPAIHNFRERRMFKEILELRDQEGLVTYTYLFSPMTGQLIPFCDSIGYGFPAATQYTNPSKANHYNGNPYTLPQADPNGLFSPASAEGTWVVCKNPNGKEARPVYVEERIVVAPFRMERVAPEKSEPKPP